MRDCQTDISVCALYAQSVYFIFASVLDHRSRHATTNQTDPTDGPDNTARREFHTLKQYVSSHHRIVLSELNFTLLTHNAVTTSVSLIADE